MMRDLIQKLMQRPKLFVYRKFTVAEFDGLQIADASQRKDLTDEFVRRIKEALELVSRTDRRRYHRVRRNLTFIVHQELEGSPARYNRWPAACVIDYCRFPFQKHSKVALIFLAVAVVHEATHALLIRRGIPYTPATRLRVERICYLEETRFVGRISRELGKGWMQRAFKPDEYERWWRQSWWQHVSGAWRRRNESRRMFQDAMQGMKDTPFAQTPKHTPPATDSDS